jgi:hypothetical protein
MKKCTKCKISKNLNEFFTDKRAGDGKTSRCKICLLQDVRNYVRTENGKASKRKRAKKINSTPYGKAATAWRGMVRRTSNEEVYPSYKNVKLKIIRPEFMEWAVPEITKFMQDNPGVRPSVDRMDSEGNYELSNLRIIPQSDNSARRGDIENRQIGKKFNCLLHQVISEEVFVNSLASLVKEFCNKKNINPCLIAKAISST